MSKRIATFINARDICPSGYYRILQFFDADELEVHQLMTPRHFRWWHKRSATQKRVLAPIHFLSIIIRTFFGLVTECLLISKGDVIIISRTISPRILFPTHRWLLKYLARHATIIWDFDDNMLELGIVSRAEHNLLSAISQRIVVTHEFLANTISPEYQHKVNVLPTTDGDMLNDSTEQLLKARLATYDTEIRLVWLGTAGNLEFLRPIIPQLEACAYQLMHNNNKRLVLHVVCNQPLGVATNQLTIVNTDWNHNAALQALRQGHIGIMPLADNNFTRGKGGFKLIQCLAAALPVVASSVGFNVHVINEHCGHLVSADITQARWAEAILTLSNDAIVYQQAAIAARNQYLANFNFHEARNQWHKWLDCQTSRLTKKSTEKI